MNRHRVPLLSGRSRFSWYRFAMAFTLILIALLALSGCGGSGGDHDDDDDGSSSSTAPAVPGCDGDTFIEAPVEASDTNTQSLTLLGLTVRIDDRTRFNNVHPADLAVGDFVDMRGFVAADGDVVATCLEREASRDEVELWGPVDADGIVEPRLFILDVEIQTGLHTVFEDGRLTQTVFFAQVQPDALVEVEGQLQADGSIRAAEVESEVLQSGLTIVEYASRSSYLPRLPQEALLCRRLWTSQPS